MGIKLVNWKCMFEGRSLMTPVIFRDRVLSIVNVSPTTSVLPKYFLATDSVITIVLGSVNAVLGLPEIIGNENTSNKVESAHPTFPSRIFSFPFFTRKLPYHRTRVVCSTC